MNIKVQDLYYICRKEIDKGNGNKIILISSDDEGNNYHELFYEFNEPSECIPYSNADEKYNDDKKYIILG